MQIKAIDAYTISGEPISSIDFMERSAQQFAKKVMSCTNANRKIYVFAGPGNNGGDALAVSRIMLENGYSVVVYLFNPKGKLSENCSLNKDRLWRMEGVHFVEVRDSFDPPDLKKEDVVIDGLFGIGLSRPLAGGFLAVVHYLNQSSAHIISLDIPSGLLADGDLQADDEAIICADKTFTFQFPKLSFFFPESGRYVGDWDLLDIELHTEAIEKEESSFLALSRVKIKSLLKKRGRFSHKGNFGHGLLIAGSKGMMGAAILASKAAMRSGIGLLTSHVPGMGDFILQTSVPEVMTSIDANADFFTTLPDIAPYKAIAIGPGLGLQKDSALALEKLLSCSVAPLLIDADALNLIAKNPLLIDKIPKESILTPHPKEFDRLFGSAASCSKERLANALEFAAKTQTYLVLKGAYTAICMPTGLCYFNTTGNAGMATAGSGDCLTGIILSLLAQSYSPADAALLGVYLHGLAGDIALEEGSLESLLASDIVSSLGLAFAELQALDEN
ncbi:carbohydrate kinase [Bacteroidales bacterium]|nr:carbohydrate kinase [Bacteroidales bacterium]